MKNILTAFLLTLYSIASAQDMKGMKMPKKESSMQQETIYTCPMHPEIKSDKPGNCPKCGMKLIAEKSKATAPKHDQMEMPKKDTSKKNDGMEDMAGMDMGDNSGTLENIKKAKLNLGPIKTISSNLPPRTVRYDL